MKSDCCPTIDMLIHIDLMSVTLIMSVSSETLSTGTMCGIVAPVYSSDDKLISFFTC